VRPPDLSAGKGPALLIHGGYDRRLALLSNRGRWPAFAKLAEWTAQVLAFLKGY
jgi:2-hydroxy-6-oxonona-2,4-dienedioate hydrolase